MTKTSKNERKYGKDVIKEPPKNKRVRRDVANKPEVEKFKILIDGSGFSKAMSYDECIKIIGEMEESARKLRRPKPSLMLVKQ
jgi:hypothetical protein